MPAYHSIFLDEANVQTIGSSDLDIDPDSESYDCLDEVLSLYRANTFFRNFEIKGPADRMMIYGILFVSECLGKVKPNMSSREAEKVLINASLDHFAIPGDAAFPLNQAFEPPKDRQDAEALRQYVVFPLGLFGNALYLKINAVNTDIYPKCDKNSQFDFTPDYTPGVKGRPSGG